jgi:dehydrogenase/reductase SDR family member 7B
MGLEHKRIWITGASSGIGEALAYEYAKAGAVLILSARSEEGLNRVRSACEHAEQHSVVPLDLEQYQGLEEKAVAVWEQHGPIDIIIHNGGQGQKYLVVDSSLELDKKIMDVNFFGAIALTRPILKRMIERNSGQIAVVSSMLGLYGIQTRAAYSASKHAIKAYFESLRNELYQTNIKITLIFPGYVNTHLTENALVADGNIYGSNDRFHKHGISSESCAKKIIKAVNNKKAVLMVGGAKERFGAFMARFFPGLFRLISPRLKV